MTELEQLKAEVATLRSDLTAFRGFLLTGDDYLRYERFPQLSGDFTHSAGSEEVLADRWEYIAPPSWSLLSPGTGIGVIACGTTNTVTPLDVTETGKILSLGVLCVSASTPFTGTEDITLVVRITVDDGTAQDIEIWDGADPKFRQAFIMSSNTHVNGGRDLNDGANNPFGQEANDAFAIDLGFEYRSSLKVELVNTLNSAFTGTENYLVAAIIHRARLVTP